MSFINKDIIIEDWTGVQLYFGPYDDKEVDRVLDANRCSTCVGGGYPCRECDSTGYSGDFEIMWVDDSNEENVYEYINY